jgi:putative flippase GtrA
MGLSPKYESIATAAADGGNLLEGIRAKLQERATLFKFAATGAAGYVVYQLVFVLFYESPLIWFLPEKGESINLLAFSHSDARLLITTLVAAELSIMGVFTGHNLWTFRDRLTVGTPIWLRFAQFNAKAAVSSLGILTLMVNLLTLGLGVTPYLAIPAGVATAFLWNWTWDSRLIWRRAERRNEGA